ncbi:unnamed protein product [Caenorhabditis bovis]|uniref:Protein kinase domain-containing protein n=1 Tax=Caenorhabditis bovis TaxID=2654633 RepID=A0A8S1F510_9PELO|nr:unnamed protein product [Caenorhabditis bovis]
MSYEIDEFVQDIADGTKFKILAELGSGVYGKVYRVQLNQGTLAMKVFKASNSNPETHWKEELEGKIVDTIGILAIVKFTDAYIRIGDFGCSEIFDANHRMEFRASMDAQTQNYRAPEVFLGLGFDSKADVWSYGCVLSEMYTGELLFFGYANGGEEVQLDLIQSVLREPIPQIMFERAFDLGSTKVVRSASTGRVTLTKRNTSFQTIKPIYKNIRFGDYEAIPLFCLILSTLTIDPGSRPTFTEILEHEYFAS